MNIFQEILDAEQRIRPYILKTPLFKSVYLSELIQGEVYFKLESEQITGSFKARGAMNKVLSLNNEEKQKGCITASTGNHAQGMANALNVTGTKGTIFLPENAVQSKIDALKHYNAELKFHGLDCLTTELYAKKYAAIPPTAPAVCQPFQKPTLKINTNDWGISGKPFWAATHTT